MSRQRLETAWDVFMLIAAVANLILILFDLSYISLRPTYIKYLPQLVRWYDPYKGIEPHWLTHAYQKLADSLHQEWRHSPRPTPERLQAFGDTLYVLSLRILSERPYERFGLMGYQELLKEKVKTFVQDQYGEKLSSSEAFRRFWQLTRENTALHLDFYQRELRYLLQVNYYRHYDLSGDFVDNFWRLDLPFLIFFWIEFWGAWIVAIRTRRYAYWWMYPVAHWYDVLALTPLRSLRWFRLLRIWNLYLRLNRSKVINFSNTLVARFLTQQSRLIAKAISDEVAYQILEQIKRQALQGEELRISMRVMEELRPVIRVIISEEAGPLMSALRRSPALTALVEESLAQGLEQAIPSLPGLTAERLLNILQRAARQATERLLQSAEAYLQSESGKKALGDLVEEFLTHLQGRLQSPQLQAHLQSAILTTLVQLQRNFRRLPETEEKK
ncbi:MAG: hypothetical protein NZ611_02220 [Bacteroidia bacterium]|nr:hypothetical protein [Bacteroidia bacterium]